MKPSIAKTEESPPMKSAFPTRPGLTWPELIRAFNAETPERTNLRKLRIGSSGLLEVDGRYNIPDLDPLPLPPLLHPHPYRRLLAFLFLDPG
jgi:hypothetical protein